MVDTQMNCFVSDRGFFPEFNSPRFDVETTENTNTIHLIIQDLERGDAATYTFLGGRSTLSVNLIAYGNYPNTKI